MLPEGQGDGLLRWFGHRGGHSTEFVGRQDEDTRTAAVVDTSAFVKHYHAETETDSGERLLIEMEAELLITRLTLIETISIFAERKDRQCGATPALADVSKLDRDGKSQGQAARHA